MAYPMAFPSKKAPKIRQLRITQISAMDEYWWRKGPRSQNPTQPRSVSAWSPSDLTTWHRRVRGSQKKILLTYIEINKRFQTHQTPLFAWYLHGICKVSELEPAIAHGSCCIFGTKIVHVQGILYHFGPKISNFFGVCSISDLGSLGRIVVTTFPELAPLVAAMICVTPSWRSSTLECWKLYTAICVTFFTYPLVN